MPTELVWSNQARADLLEIYGMIGLEQPAAAERYFDRIEEKTSLLATQPRRASADPTFVHRCECWLSHPTWSYTGLIPIRTKVLSAQSRLFGWLMGAGIYAEYFRRAATDARLQIFNLPDEACVRKLR
jgi:plasmid stabilization system protein ParE